MMHARIKAPPAHRASDFLFVVVLTLIALSIVGQWSKHRLGHPKLKGFVPAFYVDYESTVPTWYSSAALGVAATLCVLIAIAKFHQRDRFRIQWSALGGLLFALSIDEIAMFHEMPIDSLRESMHATGLLYYTWVIPGGMLVLLVACLYLRFFLHLPRTTQSWLFAAAGIFVAGAIGVEMLSGAQAAAFGEENLTYSMIITVEEFLEMIGVVILIRGLLEYMERVLGGIEIRLERA